MKFILVTDDSRKSGEDVLERHEMYCHVLLGLWNSEVQTEITTVSIYVFEKTITFTLVMGNYWKGQGRVFGITCNGQFFVLGRLVSGGMRQKSKTRRKNESLH